MHHIRKTQQHVHSPYTFETRMIQSLEEVPCCMGMCICRMVTSLRPYVPDRPQGATGPDTPRTYGSSPDHHMQ
eukprot:14859-Eustigmatos_ZCMA.PRE.1